MGKKRIFISDVHIGAGRFGDNSDSYQYDWDWLSDEETENFSKFLYFIREQYSENVKEVILIGDIFDNWVFPHDLEPPTINDIIGAQKNANVINELKKLSENLPVFYVPGNHDMGATVNVMKAHFPDITYCPEQFIAGRLIAEHGHRYALFNAPPFFSDNFFGLPLGYFISRLEATRKGITDEEGRHYRTYIDDFLEMFGKSKLPQSVFEAVLEETGLSEDIDFQVKMKGGKVYSVCAKEIKEKYKNIYEDWPEKVVSTPRAVLAELDYLDPIADKLCKNGKAKVCVFGHSHKVELDKDTWFCDDRIYANSGYWCGARCTFVSVEKEESGRYCVELLKWVGNNKIKVLEEASIK